MRQINQGETIALNIPGVYEGPAGYAAGEIAFHSGARIARQASIEATIDGEAVTLRNLTKARLTQLYTARIG